MGYELSSYRAVGERERDRAREREREREREKSCPHPSNVGNAFLFILK